MWWNIIKEFEPTFSKTNIGLQLSHMMSEIYEVKQFVQDIPEVDLKEVYAKMKEWHELAIKYDKSWADLKRDGEHSLSPAELEKIDDELDKIFDWFVELAEKEGLQTGANTW